MTGFPESVPYHRNRTFALMTTVCIALLGLAPLAGLLLHVEALKRVIPGALPVKPNMAMGFLLCATAFALLSCRTRTQAMRRWATAIAAIVVLLGALTLGEHFFGWDLPIEQWLIGNAPGGRGTLHPGRMAAASAFVFLLGGTALLVEAFVVRKQLRVPAVLGLSVALVLMGGTPLAAFLVEILLGPRWNFMGMDTSGVVGAVGFTLLGIALLILLRSDGQFTWSLSAGTTGGFLVGVLLIVVAAGAGFDFTTHMVETSNRVTHRQEVLKEIEEVLNAVTSLVSSERVYVIAGDEQLLKDRQTAKAALDQHVHHVRELTRDNPNQQRRLNQLESLIARRIDWEESVITARRQEGSAVAASMVGSGAGLELSNKLVATIKEMEAEEYRLFGDDRKQADVAVSTALSLLPMGVFLSLSILALSAFFLNAGVTQQGQAEKALRESESRLHTIVESLDEGLIVSDLNGRLLQWNRAALKLHGYSDSNQDRRRFPELVDTFELSTLDGAPVSVERWPLARILRGEEIPGLELRVRRVGSDWQRIFNYGGALVRDANNQPLLAMITITDITQRKGAEEMVRASEERHRSFFESNPNPMWVYDVETLSFLAVNNAAAEHYGYSPTEFLAMTIKDIRPAEDIPGLVDNLDQTTAGLGSSSYWRHRKKDGTVIDVEITSHELLWLGHRARVVLVKDITERKRTQERLQEQADMLDRAHDAIIVRNFDDRRIVFWNSGAERLYGWSASEAIGQPVEKLVLAKPEELGAIATILLSTGEFRGELKEITKDKRELTVEVWSTLVRNGDGTPRSVLSIHNDITEQKKLEAQLLRAQRLESIGTLASGVAHDLNNILTPILMCSQALRSELGEEDRQSALALIEESAQRGAGIVKQVLTFARGVAGERVLIKPSHLIQEIVDIARKTFSKSIDRKSVV